ncbi:MAG TPA: ABC transporter ATP-binding protein [Acidobacteriota bacterium]|nr:ABC transporter ATP-binding protein [Acidobacteriota bacterium]
MSVIGVSGLRFRYPRAAEEALKGFDFEIREGEIFGFLGPSGSGKSTTQKILTGLLPEFEGQATVLGQGIGKWGRGLYQRVGISFEYPTHFLKLTALENLSYYGALFEGERRSPQQVLEWVGLGGEGQKRVEEYSKGMKNRLSLARSLLHRPDVLFLDEPTAGLDPKNARLVRDLIRQENENGCTVFLTSHDMHLVDALCHRAAFLVEGRISTVGVPGDLKLRHGKREVNLRYEAEGEVEEAAFSLEGLGDNPEFLALLRSGRVLTMHSREATLEDVFIEVTGEYLH